jgi:RNA polymerase sigma-70 factor (ECF subfamily)
MIAATATVSARDTATFQSVRPRLFGIAYRVLGSAPDADDVVQDAWIRWQCADRGQVRDSAAFLATTTTRLAINVVRSARSRHETPIGSPRPDVADPEADPGAHADRRAALDHATDLLLARLSPAERAVYVLREAFDYPHRRIGELLGITEVNARQLGVRARRRLAGEGDRRVDVRARRRFLDAFVAATQRGELAALEELLVAERAVTTGDAARSTSMHTATQGASSCRPRSSSSTERSPSRPAGVV